MRNGRPISLLKMAAAALVFAPLGGLANAAQDLARSANRTLDLRPRQMRGSTSALRTSHREVAQDKRDAVKRRNRLRAKGQFRKAVR